MHGATLLDHKGKILRPCILWNDTRAHLEAKQLDTITKVRKISGNIVFPGFTAPKLIWLANNCLLYTSPSPRDRTRSRMPSSA